MKHFKITLGLVFLMAAALWLTVPKITLAASADITLKGVTLVAPPVTNPLTPVVNEDNNSFVVKAADATNILVNYTDQNLTITPPVLGTKITGTPKSLVKLTDWLAGETLNIKGTVTSYSAGQLVIKASEIEYKSAGVSTKTLKGTVERKDGNTLYVAVKDGKSYEVVQIDNVGVAGSGTTITPVSLADTVPGRSVQVTQLWRVVPPATQFTYIKTSTVKVLPVASASSVNRLVKIVYSASATPPYSNAVTYSNTTVPNTTELGLYPKNKLSIYNSTDNNLYLITKAGDPLAVDDGKKLKPNLKPNSYTLIPAKGTKTFQVPDSIFATGSTAGTTVDFTLSLNSSGSGPEVLPVSVRVTKP